MLCIIPARGGSKGIKNKNILPIAGKPLVAWSIEQALNCELIDRVVVSTEDKNIAEIAEKYDAEVPFFRPVELATDTCPTESVLIHAVRQLQKENYDPEAVMLLQPTSPIRKPGQLQKAIELFRNEKADSLVSVCEEHPFFWKGLTDSRPLYNYKKRPRRQDIASSDRWFCENGSIYMTKTDLLLETENRLGGRIVLFQMERSEGFDIDTLDDFLVVEAILGGGDENAPIGKSNASADGGKREETIQCRKALNQIQLLVLDVDGVLTDGGVYCSENGEALLKFSRIDGKGIERFLSRNKKVLVLSAENSRIVRKRLEKLNVDFRLGVSDKLAVLREYAAQHHVPLDRTAFIGDDVQDMEVMKAVGFSFCPGDAQPPVRKIAHWICKSKGGDGAVREVIELIPDKGE